MAQGRPKGDPLGSPRRTQRGAKGDAATLPEAAILPRDFLEGHTPWRGAASLWKGRHVPPKGRRVPLEGRRVRGGARKRVTVAKSRVPLEERGVPPEFPRQGRVSGFPALQRNATFLWRNAAFLRQGRVSGPPAGALGNV